jgi:plastocyanin
MKNRPFLLVSLLLPAALLAACSGAATSDAPAAITVQAFNMHYDPDTLELTAGQPVKLTFENNDVVDHDFSVQEIALDAVGPTQAPLEGHDMTHVDHEPELHVSTLSNTSQTLEFTPTTPGTYEYFCTVAGHKEAGMHGTLVVVAP